jgi:hypothetical protein
MGKMSVIKNFIQVVQGIEVCVEKNWIIPALTLIYSGIDSIGWIVSNEEFAKRHTFIKWAEKYLLTKKQFQCNSDLPPQT